MSKKNKKNEKPKTTQSSKVYNVKIVREKKPFTLRILPITIALLLSIGIFYFLNFNSIYNAVNNGSDVMSVFIEKGLDFIQITGFSFVISFISIVFNLDK